MELFLYLLKHCNHEIGGPQKIVVSKQGSSDSKDKSLVNIVLEPNYNHYRR